MGFALVANHPFVDGNKRVVIDVTSGVLDREGFTRWLKTKIVPVP